MLKWMQMEGNTSQVPRREETSIASTEDNKEVPQNTENRFTV